MSSAHPAAGPPKQSVSTSLTRLQLVEDKGLPGRNSHSVQARRRQFSSSSSSEEEFYSLEKKELPQKQEPHREESKEEYMPEEDPDHEVPADAHMPVYSFSQSK